MQAFADVIEAIFTKLAVRYGAAWLRQWDGVDMDLVKADWADELAGFKENLEPLRYALRHLPDRCPNVGEFRALANRCPPPELPRLAAPAASDAVVAEQVAKQLELKKALAPRADMKSWARSILSQAEAGDRVRPIRLRFAREALGLEGRMPWQGGANA